MIERAARVNDRSDREAMCMGRQLQTLELPRPSFRSTLDVAPEARPCPSQEVCQVGSAAVAKTRDDNSSLGSCDR